MPVECSIFTRDFPATFADPYAGRRAGARRRLHDLPVRLQDSPRPWCSISAVEPLPERFNAATFFVDRHVAEGRAARTAFRFRGRAVSFGELARLVAPPPRAPAGARPGVEQPP